MLQIPAPKFHRSRRPAPRALGGPLIELATYDPADSSVTIKLDRAVDFSAFDPSKVLVNDPVVHNKQYVGVGSSPSGPHQVHVTLDDTGPYSGASTLLTVLKGNGIIATDTKAELAPVANLELPFP